MMNQRLEGDQRPSAPKRRKLGKGHEYDQQSNWATASTRFSHDDYTVGWICALPLEMAAAEAMLEEIHPSLPHSVNDHNVYSLGGLVLTTLLLPVCLQVCMAQHLRPEWLRRCCRALDPSASA
jgi:hypothetical protein